ncbi:MAG TPA: hypothetical protein VES97_12765, partial [Solirubrobacteraceae bacterium]|nr:hypothetical protein [Solirubrobacteraceae bacterium]
LDKCKTGATAGEIVLSVNSELVWLDKAESEKPGEDLVLPGNLTIECTGFAKETLIVMGSVLCPITPFKKLSKTAELTCNQSKGAQEFTKYFLGGIEITDILEAEGKGIKNFALEQAGLTTTDTLTFEEEVEIH